MSGDSRIFSNIVIDLDMDTVDPIVAAPSAVEEAVSLGKEENKTGLA